MGMHPRRSHREIFPEQYSHPLAGKAARILIPGTAGTIDTRIERVYKNSRGIEEVVVLDSKGEQRFYPVANVLSVTEA